MRQRSAQACPVDSRATWPLRHSASFRGTSRTYRAAPRGRDGGIRHAASWAVQAVTSAWSSAAGVAHIGVWDVLVVDDDEDSRELIALALRARGQRCRVAVDGRDALRLFGCSPERPADIVISDWDMPWLNGAELCQKLRGLGDDAPYTYFILLTAFDDRDHLRAGMVAGADDYQRKPVNIDELEARLISASRVVEMHRPPRVAHRRAARRQHTQLRHLADGCPHRRRQPHASRRGGHDADLARQPLWTQLFARDVRPRLLQVVQRLLRPCRRRRSAPRRRPRNARDAPFVGRPLPLRRRGVVILLLEQPLADAERAMERMRARVEALGIPSANGGPLTVSVGVAELDPKVDTCGESGSRARTPRSTKQKRADAIASARCRRRTSCASASCFSVTQ